MNKMKKVLLVVLCALLLIGGSVMGTLAYLTSTATVENTFTAGSVIITMDEAKVDEYGVPEENAARVITNTYKLVPGHTYVKDPTIRVGANSEDCYLFVKITKGENFTLVGMDGWTRIGETDVWYYNQTAKANDVVTVFNEITYSASVEGNTTPGEEKLVVIAYAVQKDSFNNAKAAWDATFANK